MVLWLVVAVGVDGEFAEDFSGGGVENADVEVLGGDAISLLIAFTLDPTQSHVRHSANGPQTAGVRSGLDTGAMAEQQENGVAPEGDSSAIFLRSLAPQYVEDEHLHYVRHLERAVADKTVRNVALTGRYGSGKSSILDKFIEAAGKQGVKVQRISINTLGPDEGEDITNRIQKELVKQLVYRAAPGAISRSRFARPAELSG